MDYIKKEDAINAMNKAIDDRTWSMDDKDVMEQMEEYVKALPAADVEEVKHGHWIPTPHSIGINKTPYECSRCGMAAERKYPYCNCGAKMDGEQNFRSENN